MNKLTTQGKIVVILGSIIIDLIILCLIAHTTQYLWAWLVVPIFAVPLLNFWQALGFWLVAAWFTKGGYTFNSKDGLEETIQKVLGAFFRPLLFLFIGWVIQSQL